MTNPKPVFVCFGIFDLRLVFMEVGAERRCELFSGVQRPVVHRIISDRVLSIDTSAFNHADVRPGAPQQILF